VNIPASWRYTDAHEYMQRVREGFPPVIICCACNGGLQGQEYNTAIPETPAEIADSVQAAYEAGASMVHVHARNPDHLPGPARRVEDWREVNDRIRERCPDIIINNTTGGGPGMTDEERSFPRYDRNLNTGGNNYDEIRWLTARNTVHHSGVHPSHIVLPIIPGGDRP